MISEREFVNKARDELKSLVQMRNDVDAMIKQATAEIQALTDQCNDIAREANVKLDPLNKQIEHMKSERQKMYEELNELNKRSQARFVDLILAWAPLA